jgi:cell fate (sporulation/competence/biofilm development) regulator YlbF (YheA/YmcA/DUF963 family)
VIRQAACDFAAALAETAQFEAFEIAVERLKNDQAARRAMDAYESKYASLEMMLRLRAVSAEDQAELVRLRKAVDDQPAVTAYRQAEADVRALCQMAGTQLSGYIGLDFAGVCSSGGCC